MARTPTTQNLLARIEEMEDDDDAVDLNGLQNVDLRLKQRRKQDDTHAEPAENRELGDPSKPWPVSLIDPAERAEKIRNALILFSGPCAQDLQTIRKVRSELLSLSCVLREINILIELDTGSGLAIIEGDLKYVHENVTWILADIWKCLRRIRRGLIVKDYQETWKEITETLWKNNKTSLYTEDYQKTWKEITETSWKNDGMSLDRSIEAYRQFVESLKKTLERQYILPPQGKKGCSSQFQGSTTLRLSTSPNRPFTVKLFSTGHTRHTQRRMITSVCLGTPISPQVRNLHIRAGILTSYTSSCSKPQSTDESKADDVLRRHAMWPSAALTARIRLHSPTQTVDAAVNLYYCPPDLYNYPQILLLERPDKKPASLSRSKKLFHLNIAAQAAAAGEHAARRRLLDH
ncbi:hypothetical protein LTR70_005570 [Exophiala xenobiotica]|uniref:Uncharacterized protein n=1 Tax=Lithohypha guttulata TaxID=1690604 RepID=A0ABR0KBE7_9EURO|nr:hypothetical protein LTR24_005213 [Lithohypha guttulata]KAK5318086.1 hypothetical protein LTR70_005570 [Exophiala xenobiotica]